MTSALTVLQAADEAVHLAGHDRQEVGELDDLGQGLLDADHVDDGGGREHVVDDIVKFFGEGVDVLPVIRGDEAGVEATQELDGDLVAAAFEGADLLVVVLDSTSETISCGAPRRSRVRWRRPSERGRRSRRRWAPPEVRDPGPTARPCRVSARPKAVPAARLRATASLRSGDMRRGATMSRCDGPGSRRGRRAARRSGPPGPARLRQPGRRHRRLRR